jgi:hypothetical protein
MEPIGARASAAIATNSTSLPIRKIDFKFSKRIRRANRAKWRRSSQ